MKKIAAIFIILSMLISGLQAFAINAEGVDFYVFENFNGMKYDKKPAASGGLKLIAPAAGMGEILIKKKTNSDNYLYVQTKEPNKLNGVEFGFPKQSGDFNIQFDYMPLNLDTNIAIGSNDINLYPTLSKGTLGTFNGQTRVDIPGAFVEKGKWVNIRIDIYPSQKKFDVYFEGEKVLENVSFRTNNTAISSIKFTGGLSTTSVDVQYCVDNVMVYHPNDNEKVMEISKRLQVNNVSKTASKEAKPIPLPQIRKLKEVMKDSAALCVGKTYVMKDNFRIFLNSKNKSAKPQIIDDKMMVPAEFLAKSLQIDVNIENGRVLFDNGRLIMNRGSSEITFEGSTFNLDYSPREIDGVLYVPLRFTAEILGGSILWDNRGIAVISRDYRLFGDNVMNYMDELAVFFEV